MEVGVMKDPSNRQLVCKLKRGKTVEVEGGVGQNTA